MNCPPSWCDLSIERLNPVSTSETDITQDGFLDNSFVVLQPKKGAHRAGLDAVLLAACVPP